MHTAVPSYPSNNQTFPFYICHEDGRDVIKFESEKKAFNVCLSQIDEQYQEFDEVDSENTLACFLCGDLQEIGYERCSELQWNLAMFEYEHRKSNAA